MEGRDPDWISRWLEDHVTSPHPIFAHKNSPGEEVFLLESTAFFCFFSPGVNLRSLKIHMHETHRKGQGPKVSPK